MKAPDQGEPDETRLPETSDPLPVAQILSDTPVAVGGVLDEATIAKVRKVITDGTPANTRRAYRSDLRYFNAWRAFSGFPDVWPVAPDVVVRFVVEQVEGMPEEVEALLVRGRYKRTDGAYAWSTIERRLGALATAHRTKGLQPPNAHPVVLEVVGRARRAAAANGWAPQRKTAAVRDILERMLATCDDGTLVGIRDRALLLFGFATGGRRRSEISSAVVERLQRVGTEFTYAMGRTKTEQSGSNRVVPVAGRAAAALRAWLDAAGIESGPIFRAVWNSGTVMPGAINDSTIARIVKRRIALIGLDPEDFGAHSLRSGFLTESGRRGHSLFEAMKLSGHKDVQTASIYHQAGEVLRIGAARLLDDDLAPETAAPAAPASAGPTSGEQPQSEEAQTATPKSASSRT